jgi:hypothetical protein
MTWQEYLDQQFDSETPGEVIMSRVPDVYELKILCVDAEGTETYWKPLGNEMIADAPAHPEAHHGE